MTPNAALSNCTPTLPVRRTTDWEAFPPSIRQWLETLRPVSSRGVRAWVNDSWMLTVGPPTAARWTAQETELAITLLRPTRGELAEFVEEQDFELEDESEFDDSSWVWRDFVNGSRRIVRPGVSRRSSWFSITMAVDHFYTSSQWNWSAVALSRDLALLCVRSDDYTWPLFPYPLGVITRADKYASAALVLASNEPENPERFTSASNFFSELSASDIPDEEVYRLLLAASGDGGEAIVHTQRRALRFFRTERMEGGYADVVARLDAWRQPPARRGRGG